MTWLRLHKLEILQKRWLQDFDIAINGGVDAVIYPFRGLSIACTVRPINAAISATNPEFRFDCIVSQWSPLSGSVGDLATTQVQWPIFGAITKDITP
jgi:hypothetical protein